MPTLSPRKTKEARENYQKRKQKLALLKKISPEILSARIDFIAFRKLVCDHETYHHQKFWSSILNTGEDSQNLVGIAGRDTLILAPRGSTKSTFLAEWVAWIIGVHAAPHIRKAIKILLISYEKQTARQKSQQIQRIITKPIYQEVFPWVRKGENWSKELWEIDHAWANLPVTEEPYTLACTGLLGNTTSKRSDIIILDDIIKSPEAIANPAVREQMVSNWTGIVRPTRKDGGRAICLGTRMRPDSIYETEFLAAQDLRNKDDRLGWNVIEQSAILTRPDGSEYSYWEPSSPKAPGQSLTYLQAEREANPITFSYQFQNKVLPLVTQAIDKDLIIKSLIPSSLEVLVLGVDLSASKRESADYTAMVLGGMSYETRNGIKMPKFWIIDCWEARLMGNIEKLDAIIEIWESWKHLLPSTIVPIGFDEIESRPVVGLDIVFESNAYQLSFKGDYQTYIIGEKQILDWRVTPSNSRGDKLERLRGVSGLFDNHLIAFNQYGRLMGKLITQLTDFGSTSHDDLMDACVKCLEGLRTRMPLSTGNYY